MRRMQVLGLGIDIVEIPRVRSLYERYSQRFLERIFTLPERARSRQLRDPVPFLSGRFAAKEAILKALGTGLSGGISWQDLYIVREPSGAPRVYLAGKAYERAERLGLGQILVSISHGREHAVAQALGLAGNSEALRYSPAGGTPSGAPTK
jgi:holo-[acyl-carrier protein] synthase